MEDRDNLTAEMRVWNACVVALFEGGYPDAGNELEESGEDISKFIQKQSMRMEEAKNILAICKEHTLANVTYVAKVDLTVDSSESTIVVYAGMHQDAAINAANDYIFDTSKIPNWQYTSINRTVETWSFGKLIDTFGFKAF